MDLGTVTFDRLPSKMTPIQKKKENASVKTYSSVGFFSWAPLYEGVEILLSWPVMSQTEYDLIYALYEADAAVVFDPTDYLGSSEGTFNVQIQNFIGSYFPAFPTRRRKCELSLVIISEVV